MAEELDLHLLELARAEREVAWRDLIAKALAGLRDAERDPDAGAVQHVLEVDEDALGGFGAQKCSPFFTTESTNVRLEHQVELARLGKRAKFLGVRPKHLGKVLDLRQRNECAIPLQLVDVLGAQIEELECLLLRFRVALVPARLTGHEDALALGLAPRS